MESTASNIRVKEEGKSSNPNFKSVLLELIAGKWKGVVCAVFNTNASTTASGVFLSEVRLVSASKTGLLEEYRGKGEGKGKKEAEKEAAARLLSKLHQEGEMEALDTLLDVSDKSKATGRTEGATDSNPKGVLTQLLNGRYKSVVKLQYSTEVSTTSPNLFESTVKLVRGDGQVISDGEEYTSERETGVTKKEAEKKAAAILLTKLQQEGVLETLDALIGTSDKLKTTGRSEGATDSNPKGVLTQLLNGRYKSVVKLQYSTEVSTTSPNLFESTVKLVRGDGQVISDGEEYTSERETGVTKKEAEKKAAAMLLTKLQQEGVLETLDTVINKTTDRVNTGDTKEIATINLKGALAELIIGKWKGTVQPEFTTTLFESSPNVFESTVKLVRSQSRAVIEVGEEIFQARGTGSSKKDSEKMAARMLLNKLKEEGVMEALEIAVGIPNESGDKGTSNPKVALTEFVNLTWNGAVKVAFTTEPSIAYHGQYECQVSVHTVPAPNSEEESNTSKGIIERGTAPSKSLAQKAAAIAMLRRLQEKDRTEALQSVTARALPPAEITSSSAPTTRESVV
eukprot:CAMPEP_0182437068 /NCGR_PEP_ID=MMETSP1167-20130531/84796_1 /TAXON_ID=2988 /ORGANISM="Mallomonas Sp, Strain CCMP3275" /LENGTH=568 /DNA_ID=CAMNT_0024629855 /DNA_START=101 /DNA_END=1807 /DNA_ORIENTATION=-